MKLSRCQICMIFFFMSCHVILAFTNKNVLIAYINMMQNPFVATMLYPCCVNYVLFYVQYDENNAEFV